MGYFGMFDSRSVKDYIKEEFTKGKTAFENRVVYAHAVGNTVYSAVKIAEDKIIAVVTLVRKDPDGYIMTKDMDETAHPYYYGANKKLISMLTSTDSENAISWRSECLKKYN